jgi:cobalt-zinc-cadmium efflux system membrane fusion protein
MNRGPRKLRQNRTVTSAFAAMLAMFLVNGSADAQITATSSEEFSLSDQELINLGIRFAPVIAISEEMGIRVPSLVIASPHKRSRLIATVEGEVREWRIELGESFAEGDILAIISSAMASEQQAAWIETRANLENARLESLRTDKLFAEGIVAQRRQQQSQIALQQAIQLEASAAQAIDRLGFDSASRAELALNNTYLGYALLRAPDAGRLVHQTVRKGLPVNPGDVLAELEPSSPKWLSINLSSTMASGLQVGSRLRLADSAIGLTLRQREYSIDPATQSVEILAEFDGSVDFPLGTNLQVILEPPSGGVLVPASAVVYSNGQTQVFIRRDDKIQPRSLELLPIGRDYSAVSGLAVGEEIAVDGTALLKGMQLGLGGDS